MLHLFSPYVLCKWKNAVWLRGTNGVYVLWSSLQNTVGLLSCFDWMCWNACDAYRYLYICSEAHLERCTGPSFLSLFSPILWIWSQNGVTSRISYIAVSFKPLGKRNVGRSCIHPADYEKNYWKKQQKEGWKQTEKMRKLAREHYGSIWNIFKPWADGTLWQLLTALLLHVNNQEHVIKAGFITQLTAALSCVKYYSLFVLIMDLVLIEIKCASEWSQ